MMDVWFWMNLLVCWPPSRLSFGLEWLWQVGVAGTLFDWLRFWWRQKGNFGGASQHTGWHSWQSGEWQSSEADSEGWEYTRLRSGGLDRLLWLAHCCCDKKSDGGKSSPQQGDEVTSPFTAAVSFCMPFVKCTFVNVQGYSVSSYIMGGFSSLLYTGCVSTEAGTPASCKPRSQLVFLPDVDALALLLFLFHVVITYVCPQRSLSTQLDFSKWDITHGPGLGAMYVFLCETLGVYAFLLVIPTCAWLLLKGLHMAQVTWANIFKCPHNLHNNMCPTSLLHLTSLHDNNALQDLTYLHHSVLLAAYIVKSKNSQKW